MAELQSFLVLSAILFSIGVYGILSKKSAIRILISIEIMLNAVLLNFVAFSSFQVLELPFVLTGHLFAMFVITIAAAEAAVGLALMVVVYRANQSIEVSNLKRLKG